MAALVALMKMVPWRNFPSPPWIFAWKVVRGMNTTSSESWPVGVCPLRPATATTWNGMLRMRTVWPTGFELGPKSLSATVAPSTTTLVPVSTSESVKRVPSAMGQLRISK